MDAFVLNSSQDNNYISLQFFLFSIDMIIYRREIMSIIFM